MLNDAIRGLRNALMTITVLSAFLVLTTLDFRQRVQQQHDAELLALSYQLLTGSAERISMPYDSDEEEVTIGELGIEVGGLANAIAHYSYSLTHLFEYEFCRDGAGVMILEWNQWQVFVDDAECSPMSVRDIYIHYRDTFDYYSGDDYVDALSEINSRELSETLRLPDGLDEFVVGDLGSVELDLYRRVDNCVSELIRIPEEEYPSSCDFYWAEAREATRLYSRHLGLSVPDPGRASVQPATLLASAYHTVGETEYRLDFTNHAWSRPNIDGEAYGYANVRVDVIVDDGRRYSSEELASELVALYAAANGLAAREDDIAVALAWIESESRNLYDGVISLPIVGLSLPVVWFLTGLSALLLALFFWSNYLVVTIARSSLQGIEVPWMLLVWQWVGEDRSKSGIAFVLQTVTGIAFLMARAAVFLFPGIYVTYISVLGDHVAYNYLVLDDSLKVLIVLLALTMLVFGVLTVVQELRISRLLYRKGRAGERS